ncbi:VOC family protein [Aeromonas jandaei]|uniref:VOC family protein n=1 Tax=Aeromonas jandaei TaxID=650 RepID=UPI000F544871|nr:VOC family protein [Aeromonas jandaei]RQM78639.1 VOC family protein [Aeromonas jandaei]
MKAHEKLNYVEFAARDLAATKAFFQAVFGWQFVDYGPDYCAFADEGLDGGFYRADQCNLTAQGGALLVFYSADIEATQSKVAGAGGTIVRPLFDFPGGRRFHFVEPSGNEFAVWSELHDISLPLGK